MKKDLYKYLFSLVLFGSNGIIASRIPLSSVEIVLLRTLLGSALLLAIFLLSGNHFTFFHHRRQACFLAVSGVAMGLSWIFLFEAYQRIGVSMATLAYYCAPVIVMALSPLLFHERLTAPKIAGFLTVLAGVFLVNGQAAQTGASGWGLFCGGMSAILYAVMVISNKKVRDIRGLENPLGQLLIGFLTVAAFVGVRQGGFALSLPADSIPWVLLLGLLNTGVGCYLYFSSIGALPVQTVAICGYLDPLSAVLLAAIILGETMTPVQILGAVLILGGAALGELAGNRPVKSSASPTD